MVLRGADAIVAVSQFTKDEVVELAGIPAERVRVVPNGVDPIFRASESPSDTVSQGDYFLAVATLEPRKNLERVVEAARLAGVELRVVGARGWGGVDVPGWVGEIPDAELVQLYRGARCVVYASLYEGFGLPVLEAMASGTPVVAAPDPALMEVAGDAAVYADADDLPGAILRALERREELQAAGLARAAQFSWAEAARRTVEIYRGLL
jgi:alpha-1,3-rhamnosyl/mannosyltransferase